MIYLFVIPYCFSVGPVPWVYCAEVSIPRRLPDPTLTADLQQPNSIVRSLHRVLDSMALEPHRLPIHPQHRLVAQARRRLLLLRLDQHLRCHCCLLFARNQGSQSRTDGRAFRCGHCRATGGGHCPLARPRREGPSRPHRGTSDRRRPQVGRPSRAGVARSYRSNTGCALFSALGDV